MLILMSFLTKNNIVLAENPITFTDKNTKYNFILIEYNNEMAFFKTGDLYIPYYVINLDVSSLPLKDQEELKKGILIADDVALNKVIEDYTG